MWCCSWGNRGLKNIRKAYACFLTAGIPRKPLSWATEAVHAWMRWRQSYQGNNCDRAGLAEPKLAVGQLRSAEAQPADPVDKKRLLLEPGEVEWCWRCGARAERNSAPSVLLKTACSGAPRTTEDERALTLLGKGQHPKSSVLEGQTTPISDEELHQWHGSHGSLLFCLCELSRP